MSKARNGNGPRSIPGPTVTDSLSNTPKVSPAAGRSPETSLKTTNYGITHTEASALFEGGVTGLENVTARDLLIPRITILQSLSPQLNPSKAEFIEGAKLGQFCDVGTGEIFNSLMVIPCFYVRVFIEWGDRRTGKGLVKNHGMDGSVLERCKQDENRRFITPEGNYIAETAQFYVLNVTAGNRRSFIPMASTQLRASRRWLTMATAERVVREDGVSLAPPLFFRAWNASTRPASNNQGDWLLWHMESGPKTIEIDPSLALLKEAKEFAKAASAGLVMGDMGREDETVSSEEAPF